MSVLCLLLLSCVVLQITIAEQLEAATRSLAAECLITLCEARDKVGGCVLSGCVHGCSAPSRCQQQLQRFQQCQPMAGAILLLGYASLLCSKVTNSAL